MSKENYATMVAEVDLTTADGTMNCHVITPERDGTLRAVIVYMPASGIRPELVDIAGRIAENDIYVGDEETAALKAHSPTIDVPHTVETYPGTEHGFVFPERYCFSPEGAELHYVRLADLFARNLG